MTEDFVQFVDLRRWPTEEAIWFLIYVAAIAIFVSVWVWIKQRRSHE